MPAARQLVTSAGSNGKFPAVVDLDVGARQVTGVRYELLPIFSALLPEDASLASEIATMRDHDRAMLDEKLADTGQVLFRSSNSRGVMDQVICNALRQELDAETALSPGFRCGPGALTGEAVAMEFLLSHTATTYPDPYVQTMTGADLSTVMEDVCDNLFDPDPYMQQGGVMVRVGGLDYA
jgi:sulfur-oxidizing protein SoxB